MPHQGYTSSKLAIWVYIYFTTISVFFLYFLFCIFQISIILVKEGKRNRHDLKNINSNKLNNILLVEVLLLLCVQGVSVQRVNVLGGKCLGG